MKKENKMKNTNQLKSTNAVYSDGTYKIINIEPDNKGSWVVVKNNIILFASSKLTVAKRYVANYTFYGADESLQIPVPDKSNNLKEKLATRLKVIEREMMTPQQFRKFVSNFPKVKIPWK